MNNNTVLTWKGLDYSNYEAVFVLLWVSPVTGYVQYCTLCIVTQEISYNKCLAHLSHSSSREGR